MQKAKDFRDRLVEVFAAPEFYTATAEPKKTLTNALVEVLEGESGILMSELEGKLREMQVRQGSSNTPRVVYRDSLKKELFPF